MREEIFGIDHLQPAPAFENGAEDKSPEVRSDELGPLAVEAAVSRDHGGYNT